MFCILIGPEKFVYLRNLQECRDKPYNEMVLEKVAKNISDTCPKPCRSRHNHGKRLNKLLDHLSYCSDWRDQKCTTETEKGTNLEGIPLKPCTQMDYKSESTPSTTNLKNVANDKSSFGFGNFKNVANVETFCTNDIIKGQNKSV